MVSNNSYFECLLIGWRMYHARRKLATILWKNQQFPKCRDAALQRLYNDEIWGTMHLQIALLVLKYIYDSISQGRIGKYLPPV